MLIDEYGTLASESRDPEDGFDWDRLRGKLVSDADWTPAAAEELVALATRYGVFMLRNALALADALEIEDGELGY